MNASKENCRKALEEFESKFDGRDTQSDWFLFIVNFFSAAEKKLPKEASFPVPGKDLDGYNL